MAGGSERKGAHVAVERDQVRRTFLLLTLLIGQKSSGELPLKEDGHEAGELRRDQEGKPVLQGEDMLMLHIPSSHTRRFCILPYALNCPNSNPQMADEAFQISGLFLCRTSV